MNVYLFRIQYLADSAIHASLFSMIDLVKEIDQILDYVTCVSSLFVTLSSFLFVHHQSTTTVVSTFSRHYLF